MRLKLLAVDTLHVERAALAAEFQQATGRPLRRAGSLAAMALLACRRCTQSEQWPQDQPREALPTLLLWHTPSVIAEEAARLLTMMLHDREAVMPFDFLASQPALLGVTLHPHFPELSNAICMPWVDEDGTAIWQRSLLLAAHWLADKACQRVLCVHLERDTDGLQAYALSLSMQDGGPQAIAELQLGPASATAETRAARDFVARLTRWLQTPGLHPLRLDGDGIRVRASVKSAV